MSKKLYTKLDKFNGFITRVFTSISRDFDEHGTPRIKAETKPFAIGNEKNFKIYFHGTLNFNGNDLEKYGTYIVLSQKIISQDKEKIVHSFHFDGNINESKADHPIFHMQFDNTLIAKMEPEKYQKNFFDIQTGEVRRIRIPTPQLDIISFIYFYLQAIDTKSMAGVKFNYLDFIAREFNISSIQHGYGQNISKVLFP